VLTEEYVAAVCVAPICEKGTAGMVAVVMKLVPFAVAVTTATVYKFEVFKDEYVAAVCVAPIIEKGTTGIVAVLVMVLPDSVAVTTSVV